MTPELRASIEKRAHEIVEAFKQDRTAAGLKRYLADEMFGIASLAQQQERERMRLFLAKCAWKTDEIESAMEWRGHIVPSVKEMHESVRAAIRKDQTE